MPMPKNYIQRLQAEKLQLERYIAAMQVEVMGIKAHMELPKFQGTDSDGERRDWISTQDVRNMMENILNLRKEDY